jgi:uncharacterized protein GlcG (DUF336 family)
VHQDLSLNKQDQAALGRASVALDKASIAINMRRLGSIGLALAQLAALDAAGPKLAALSALTGAGAGRCLRNK